MQFELNQKECDNKNYINELSRMEKLLQDNQKSFQAQDLQIQQESQENQRMAKELQTVNSDFQKNQRELYLLQDHQQQQKSLSKQKEDNIMREMESLRHEIAHHEEQFQKEKQQLTMYLQQAE